MLTETAAPVIGQALIDELASHVKLSAGFGTDAAAELEGSLRAALAHLEARLGLALIERDFIWRGGVAGDGAATAPIGPVSLILNVDRIKGDGSSEVVDFTAWTLDQRSLRTRFQADRYFSDQLDITFRAGFGPAWTNTPADLRRAVLMLAAHFFENRYATSTGIELLPLGVKDLVAPWRPVRVGFGGAS